MGLGCSVPQGEPYCSSLAQDRPWLRAEDQKRKGRPRPRATLSSSGSAPGWCPQAPGQGPALASQGDLWPTHDERGSRLSGLTALLVGRCSVLWWTNQYIPPPVTTEDAWNRPSSSLAPGQQLRHEARTSLVSTPQEEGEGHQLGGQNSRPLVLPLTCVSLCCPSTLRPVSLSQRRELVG